jgi:hypothetical protein
MPCFEEMFLKTKGQPITYQGKTLGMMDGFPTKGATKIRLIFETCNGE